MKPLFVPQSEGVVAELADIAMMSAMYLLQGNLKELPQRTHVWNNKKLPSIASLDVTRCVQIKAISCATPRYRYGVPIFHIPICGGWREFVVLEPARPYETWYVGWVAADAVGYSQVPLDTAARLLIGDSPVTFFAVDTEGYQVSLQRKATGRIGQAGYFATLPLL